MQERRKHQRQKTYLGAQTVYDGRYCVIDCLVRNVSQDGARLVLADGEWILPTEFELLIPHKGDSRPARIAWRKQADLGVQFLADVKSRRLPVEATRRLNALKKQNAALARRVADLSEPAY